MSKEDDVGIGYMIEIAADNHGLGEIIRIKELAGGKFRPYTDHWHMITNYLSQGYSVICIMLDGQKFLIPPDQSGKREAAAVFARKNGLELRRSTVVIKDKNQYRKSRKNR